MTKICIVGAGFSGLELARKLVKEKGFDDLILIESRTGYTRPGYISTAYLPLEDEILYSLPTDREIHLKEIERRLQKDTHQLQIRIEKKEFLHFSHPNQGKGIIVRNDKNQEEFIPCEIVFDCTGSKRAVVNQVNKQAEEPGFTMQVIADNIPTKKHLLFYVYMDPSSYTALQKNFHKTQDVYLKDENALEYVTHLEKLRALGWHEKGYPRCFGAPFEKNKVCLYLEAPESLDNEHILPWAQTAFNAIAGQEISFQQLKPSRKYDKKPRIMLFEVNPVMVEEAAFRHDNFPLVIPVGDARIDPYYSLGHGLLGIIEQINLLLPYLNRHHDTIDFNDQSYLNLIRSKLESHQESIRDFVTKRCEYFSFWLRKAQFLYQTALAETTDPILKTVFSARLDEVKTLLQAQGIDTNASPADVGFFSHSKRSKKENTTPQTDLGKNFWDFIE